MEENKVITGVFENNTNDINDTDEKENTATTPLDSLVQDTESNRNLNKTLNKKVSVEKFVKGVERLIRTGLGTEQLKKDFGEYVASHVNVDYVPYEEKVNTCNRIARTSHYTTIGEGESAVTYFKQDSTIQSMLFDLSLIDLYTDIEVRFSDHSLDDYNMLEKYDCINLIRSAIPEYEIAKMEAIMSMVIDDIYENERSMVGIIQDTKNGIKNVFGIVKSEFVKQLQASGLSLDDVIKELGLK